MPNLDALRDSLTVSEAEVVVIPAKAKEVAGDRHVVVVDRQGGITRL